MDNFGNYMRAQAERQAAFERYTASARALENAQIHERLAEIKSQHEPLSTLLAQPLNERDMLYAAAYYVVVGRMPACEMLSEPPATPPASKVNPNPLSTNTEAKGVALEPEGLVHRVTRRKPCR